MTLFQHITRHFLRFPALISILFLVSCATGKKTTVPPPPVVVVPDTIEHYNCGFKPGIFTGRLPCFGDECSETGAPVTLLNFHARHLLSKTLERAYGTTRTIPGHWSIREDCIIEINYEDSTREYYKFHEGVNKLERLTPAQQSFPGTLNKHNYLSKTR